MKKLIAGLGLTVLAVPAAQAWTGGIDDMRTLRANEHRPVVRIKRHHVDTVSCGQCQVRYSQQHRRPQATGWQRSARVVPHGLRRHQPVVRPVRPVQMHAYYVPLYPLRA